MTAPDCPAQIELECGPVAAIDLALYAAGSGDHNALHLDAEAARAAGFDKPLVHGMLTMAYVGHLFTQRFGVRSLRALSTRFVGLAKLGDTVKLTATLASVDAQVATYEVRARNDRGADLITGTARVALSNATGEK